MCWKKSSPGFTFMSREARSMPNAPIAARPVAVGAAEPPRFAPVAQPASKASEDVVTARRVNMVMQSPESWRVVPQSG
jgi:hypothetical protein